MIQSTSDVRIVPSPEIRNSLTDILRQGARDKLVKAIQAEVADWIESCVQITDSTGRRQVVRNGSHPERKIFTGLWPITIQQPRVLDRQSPHHRETFTPNVLPPYLRRTRNVDEAIPWLFLMGISTGDFPEALQGLFGIEAKGLSANKGDPAQRGMGGGIRSLEQAVPGGQALRLRLGRRAFQHSA